MSPTLVLLLALAGDSRPVPVPLLMTPEGLDRIGGFDPRRLEQVRENIARMDKDIRENEAPTREPAKNVDPRFAELLADLERMYEKLDRTVLRSLKDEARRLVAEQKRHERQLQRSDGGLRQELLRRWDAARRKLWD